jgi:hypothetical protein
MSSSWKPCLLLSMLAVLYGASGSVPVREVEKRYEITGRTAADLRRAASPDDQPRLKQTIRRFVISSIAKRTPSRPIPLILLPP